MPKMFWFQYECGRRGRVRQFVGQVAGEINIFISGTHLRSDKGIAARKIAKYAI